MRILNNFYIHPQSTSKCLTRTSKNKKTFTSSSTSLALKLGIKKLIPISKNPFNFDWLVCLMYINLFNLFYMVSMKFTQGRGKNGR